MAHGSPIRGDGSSMIDSSINRRSNLIIKSFNSPSLILSKIQESSDLGWREDEEKSIFISSFGNIQIIFNDDKNEIEINPIEETEDGWENLINWIHEEDKKLMENIINKFMDYSSIYSIREMESEEIDGWEGFNSL